MSGTVLSINIVLFIPYSYDILFPYYVLENIFWTVHYFKNLEKSPYIFSFSCVFHIV